MKQANPGTDFSVVRDIASTHYPLCGQVNIANTEKHIGHALLYKVNVGNLDFAD